MVDAQYGGITPYLEDVLGLDVAARSELAQRYLQAV
jgi:protein-tyrosine phosphatase